LGGFLLVLSVSNLPCPIGEEMLLVEGRSALRGRAGVLWRQELNARPVLVYPAIPDVDRDAEAMGEVASGGG
jgi:hypothetical protein